MSQQLTDLGGPVSASQQAIWLNEQQHDVGSVYHMPFSLALRGKLDRDALHVSCSAVVDRHPALALAVEERDGLGWLRPALRRPELVVEPVSPAGLDEAVRAQVRERFDLTEGPLLRMTLFAVGSEEHVLLVVAHHLVFDGESMEIFKRDLASAYAQARSGGPVTAEPIGPSPAEYHTAEQDRIASALPPARRYWRSHLVKPVPLELPGFTDQTGDIDSGACVEFLVGDDVRRRLKDAAAGAGVSRFEFLLASFYALLYRYGNETPVITVAFGTRTDQTAGCIGGLGGELPLAQPGRADLPFADFAAALRTDLRQLYEFRHVPLNRAVTGIRPGAMHTAVSVTYRRHDRHIDLSGLDATATWLFNSASRGALWIQLLDEEDGLRVLLRYPDNAFAVGDVVLIRDHWTRLLDAAIAAPRTAVDDLPLADPLPRHQNITAAAPEVLVPEMVSRRAAENPGKIAVICGAERLTYEQLMERMQRLSHDGPTTLDRTVDLAATQLAAAAFDFGDLSISHRKLAERVNAYRYLTNPADTWLAHTSASAPASLLELFLPLAAGAKLVIATAREVADPRHLVRLARRHRVTHLHATTTGWTSLLENGFEGVRCALVSGERLSPALALRLQEKVGALTHVYGRSPLWALAGSQPNTGKPLGNVRASVLDSRGRPLATGVTGELFISSGAGQAVSTGELARSTMDGSIELLGQRAERVRRNGHWIDLAALSTQITSSPGVIQTVIVADQDDIGECRKLTAYIRTNGDIGEPAVRARVPIDFVRVDEFPLTVDGTVDRAALGRTTVESTNAKPGEAGHPQIERELVEIWQDVLRRKNIGVHDNLFDFGVNSLAVTRIAARIRQRMRVAVALETFYDMPTIAQIAAVVARSGDLP